METKSSVLAYVDPSCPFAWITARWLMEVARQRPIELGFEVMSLSVLNEHKTLEPWYREFNDRAWGPARVCAAVARHHGAQALARLYPALGRRIHDQGNKNFSEVLPEALEEVGLARELAEYADRPEADPWLRASTACAQRLVGEELGTPTVIVDGAAFFGPVLTSVPRGQDAVRIFDGARLLAGSRVFTELKRARTDALSFA